jgi:Fe-S-cluster containining protein
MKKINCSKCKIKGSCCRSGVWVDLEEAKNIVKLDLSGKFYDLIIDDEFPSGWKISTSSEDMFCSFLCPDGLCAIHKVNYKLKPKYCKEFPYQDGKIENYAKQYCVMLK